MNIKTKRTKKSRVARTAKRARNCARNGVEPGRVRPRSKPVTDAKMGQDVWRLLDARARAWGVEL